MASLPLDRDRDECSWIVDGNRESSACRQGKSALQKLEGVGEHVRIEVSRSRGSPVKSRSKSANGKKRFSCRLGFRRENSLKNANRPPDLMSRRHPLRQLDPLIQCRW
jgi:hypothetical protein